LPSFRFTEGERFLFRRRPPIPVSEWAARHIVVQDGPYRGTRLRPEVSPYLAGIMDAWGRPEVEEVCVCGSPQTGKTLAMYSCLGYSIDRRPGTKMLAMPDDKALGRVEAEKLTPLLARSPALARLVDKMITGHVRLREGSSLYLSSAQSRSQRASITVKDLFLDEEDLYMAFAGQGDPVTDFRERTRSYSFDRKIMRASKPVGDAGSSIWRAITEHVDATMAYEVVCPICGQAQIPRPDGVEAMTSGEKATPAEIERRRLGRYRCEGCGGLWDDHGRDRAVAGGRWVPIRIGEADLSLPRLEKAGPLGFSPRRIGFWLPAILVRSVSLSELAAGGLRAGQDDGPAGRQAHANSDWAMPYVAVETEPSEEAIVSRIVKDLPARAVPEGAIALTCGIDVQKRGFYYLVLAWMPSMSRYVVDYGRLAEFDEVAGFVHGMTYPVLDGRGDESGARMEIWRCAMDTGGGATDEGPYSRTEEAYEFLRMYGHGRIWGIKGASRDQTPTVRWTTLDKMPGQGTAIKGGLMLFMIDTGKVKSGMFDTLLNPDAARKTWLYGHDPLLDDQAGLHGELIRHLTAEHQIRTSKGRLVWKAVHKDNHFLDCLMGATACGDVSWTPSLHHEIMRMSEARAVSGAQERTPRPARHDRPRRAAGW
jgi:phage terminase large subunit GpA-like protein